MLGWGAWTTYLHRAGSLNVEMPVQFNVEMPMRSLAMLGGALGNIERFTEALPVLEALVASIRRLESTNATVWIDAELERYYVLLQECYMNRDRLDDALHISREVWENIGTVLGPSHERALKTSIYVINALFRLERYDDARTLADKQLVLASRAYGNDHAITRGFAKICASRGDAR